MKDVTDQYLPINNSFTCQYCQKEFESKEITLEDFTERQLYHSPICNVCLLRAIIRNGGSIKKSLRVGGKYLEFRHFPDLYKLLLSSVKTRVKVKDRILLNLNLNRTSMDVFGVGLRRLGLFSSKRINLNPTQKNPLVEVREGLS